MKKRLLLKLTVACSATLLTLGCAKIPAAAFTVTNTNATGDGITLDIKAIKELGTLSFNSNSSTPSQSLAQIIATLVSHDSVRSNGPIIDVSAQTVLKYFYPNDTDTQLQTATLTADQAVVWLHSVGYSATIINRPLTTSEIKSYLDKSEPIITVLASQNTGKGLAQSEAGILYAHDDEDAGTRHLHKSFIKSSGGGEAAILDGTEAQTFTFSNLSGNESPAEQAASFKWVSSIVDIKYNSSANVADTANLYRLYNPNSGEHFYTLSPYERDSLVKAGWNDEGIAEVSPATSSTPVYRVYNPNAGDHHYTTGKAEVDHLVSVGWKDEGIAFYSGASTNTKVYRLYNPNAISGAHFYTESSFERDSLVAEGWKYEGTSWYALP